MYRYLMKNRRYIMKVKAMRHLLIFFTVLMVNVSVSAQTIGGDVFGGCKAADVNEVTYVEIKSGTMSYVFGGNDKEGNVKDSTYVKVYGTAVMDRVFGGHNAYYSEKTQNGTSFTYSHTGFPFPEIRTGVIPQTRVELLAGKIRYDVYGAGFAGDVNNSRLIINGIQIGGVTVGETLTEGRVFGAGCGDYSLIGKKVVEFDTIRSHCGNVIDGTAVTTVGKMDAASNCIRIMGGGYAGDASNIDLRVFESFNHYVPVIYGGCWAGNVSGTAKTNIKGNLSLDTVAGEVFGGNDYAGWVANTDLTISQGNFRSVYGGGNGKYDYKTDLGNLSSGEIYDTIPGSGKIIFTIWDPSADSTTNTHFYGNVYGGGKMAIVGDSTICSGNAPSSRHGQIVMHVHGGYYEKHIYAGGMGMRNSENNKRFFGRNSSGEGGDNSLQLVYGLKVLNVYNCYVHMDIHGGSEFVDDGFPFECISKDNTTLRPSSIVNVLGGHFHHNLYGGGYEGTVFGSVYVNIGRDAILNAEVLNKSPYSDITYEDVFPKYYKAQNISIEGSIYNVSDYGDAGSIKVFNTPGVKGGESHIFIDGSSYYTGFNGGNSSNLPTMNIAASIVGSGTSTEGGDVERLIIMRHYGANNCDVTSKTFYSIQRADKVILDSVYVSLTGEKDVYYAYPSPSYTLCRIDTLILHTDNFVTISNPGIYIGGVRSQYKKSGGTYNNYNYWTNTSNVGLYGIDSYESINTACEDSCSFYNANRNQNVILIKRGTYVNIMPFEADANGENVNFTNYGSLEGYCFLTCENGYQSFVFARRKVSGTLGENDGGFLHYCKDSMPDSEMKYVNSTGSVEFRTWKLGIFKGNRSREIVIVAQGDENFSVTGGKYLYTDYNSSEVELKMPPVYSQNSRGCYYRISSVSIDPSRDKITLINQAYMPDVTSPNVPYWKQVTSEVGNAIGALDKDTTAIDKDPNKTFGLLFYTDNGFSSGNHTVGGQTSSKEYILPTQDFLGDKLGGAFMSSKTDGSSPIPTIKFVLTYSKNYKTTTAANVLVTMWEYDSNDNPVAPIDLTITIYTVKNNFLNDTLEAVAFYNEGYTNESVRHVAFPITFDRGRNLYLQEVKWEWYKIDPDNTTDTLFKLDNITGTPNSAQVFSVSLHPTDIVAGTPASISWTSREAEFNVLAGCEDADPVISTPSTNGTYNVVNRYPEKGRLLGVLDGRSIASIDCKLSYNGKMNYKGDTIVGAVIMKFYYESNAESYGWFYVKLNVRTRSRTDTIYMASAESVSRKCFNSSTDTTVHAYGGGEFNVQTAGIGKSPDMYVRSFSEAFQVYIPGDVIAVIDTVKIDSNVDLALYEDKNYGNKVLSERVQIIRYSGSSSRFPGREKIYNGPLVKLTGNGYFKADYIDFNGSACTRVAKYKRESNGIKIYERKADTIIASAPVIWVQDSAILDLLYVNIFNNINGATENSIYKGGAIGIGVTKPNMIPEVYLSHRCLLFNNMVIPSAAVPNQGGAIYNDRGKLQVGVYDGDIVTASNNYILEKSVYKSSLFKDSSDVKVFDFSSVAWGNSTLSNVYLTRTPSATDAVFKDAVSSYISINSSLGFGTRVGVSKWFPGRNLDHKRDTIFFAVSSNPYAGYARLAYENGAFFSDTLGIDTAYSSMLGPQLYLHICALRMWQAWDSVRFNYSIASARFTGEPLSIRIDTVGGVGPFNFSWYDQNTDELLQEERNVMTRESSYFLTTSNASTESSGNNRVEREYFCMMQTTDLLGCDLVQRMAVKIVEVDDASQTYYYDTDNWLGKGKTNAIEIPGVDSNNFRTDNTILVSQFLRTYRVWNLRVIANVAPGSDRGTVIDVNTGMEYDNTQTYYPGDIVSLWADSKDDEKYSFMFWDYEVTSGDTLRVVVPYEDLTVTAYFGPTPVPPTHWYKHVTSRPAGYVVAYDGHVTITSNEGLAWLISTVNGLNGQQARTFVYDTIDIVAGTYDMGAYRWTPLGNVNHPFKGVFRGVKSGSPVTYAEPDEVVIKNLFVDEKSLPFVGMFGKIDSARVSNFTLDNSYIYGSNFASTVSAVAVNEADIHDIRIHDAIVAGSTYIGGVVAQADNVSIYNMEVGSADKPVNLLGDVIQAGGFVGNGSNVSVRNNSGNISSSYLNALYVGGALASSSGGEVAVDSVKMAANILSVDPTLYMVNEDCTPSVRVMVSNKGAKDLSKFSVQAQLVSLGQTSESLLGSVKEDYVLNNPLSYGSNTVFELQFPANTYTVNQNDTNGNLRVKIIVTSPVDNADSLKETGYYPLSVVSSEYDYVLDTVIAPATKPTNTSITVSGSITNKGKENLTGFSVTTYWYDGSVDIENNTSNPIGSITNSISNLEIASGSSYFFTQTLPASTFVYDNSTNNSGDYRFKMSVSVTPNNSAAIVREEYAQCTTEVVAVNEANKATTITGDQNKQLTATWDATNKVLTMAGYVKNLGYNQLTQYLLYCQVKTSGGDSTEVITTSDLHIYTAGVEYGNIHHFSRNIDIQSQSTPNYVYVVLKKINATDDMEEVRYITVTNAANNGSIDGVPYMSEEEDADYARFLAESILPDSLLIPINLQDGMQVMGLRTKDADGRWRVMSKTKLENNYVNISTGVKTSRVAGLISTADNTLISNNYVYGTLNSGSISSSLIVQMGDSVQIDHCYYLSGTADNVIGNEPIPIKRLITSFTGSVNNCVTTDYIEGVNNLTRLLNIWVRDHEEEASYKTWRSDYSVKNNGYPVFGEPDLIKVYDTIMVETCDEYHWDNQHLFESGVYEASYKDEETFVDSSITLFLTLHNSQIEEMSDSASLEAGYYAYGFHITPQMLKQLWGSDNSSEVKVFRFVDSLLTVNGCDSLLILELSVYKQTSISPIEKIDLHLYPNPTHDWMVVEAEGIKHIELVDALGHTLYRQDVSSDRYSLDMRSYPKAAYYLRIFTEKGIWVKKVVKK